MNNKTEIYNLKLIKMDQLKIKGWSNSTGDIIIIFSIFLESQIHFIK
jgi:hypothetical protein